jgi:hypothetical protein
LNAVQSSTKIHFIIVPTKSWSLKSQSSGSFIRTVRTSRLQRVLNVPPTEPLRCRNIRNFYWTLQILDHFNATASVFLHSSYFPNQFILVVISLLRWQTYCCRQAPRHENVGNGLPSCVHFVHISYSQRTQLIGNICSCPQVRGWVWGALLSCVRYKELTSVTA